MSSRHLIFAMICGGSLFTAPLLAGDAKEKEALDHGRYLVTIGGCNDCHTTGWAESGGQVPESEWLKGDGLGWQGPWGTTYAPNLRLSLAHMSEDEWVVYARNLQTRPPMPWFALHQMTETDLRALYTYVHSLQPLGDPAPVYLPPGQQAAGPVVVFPAPPPGD